MAHVRYATAGRKDQILQDAHPQVIGGKVEDRGNHVVIRDCEKAIIHNGHVKDFDPSLNIPETTSDTESLLHAYAQVGERGVLERIVGAYTCAIADKEKKDVMVLRDRTGIKPGVLGKKDGKHCIASEDVAFQKGGAELIEELEPGSVYYLSPAGTVRKEKVVKPKIRHCKFEGIYLQDPDSHMNGASVRTIRWALGEALADEVVIEDADYVTFIPRCPKTAARAYSEQTGIPFSPVFYKLNSERAFQGSDAEERASSIEHNLFLLPEEIKKIQGKKVVVIDDSQVRGSNAKYVRHLLYEIAGVKEAHLLLHSPPIGIIGEDGEPRGCEYGVDMPPNDNFIARDRTLDEISEEVGMPVHYLTLERTLKVFKKFGMPKAKLCYFCMGGPRPF